MCAAAIWTTTLVSAQTRDVEGTIRQSSEAGQQAMQRGDLEEAEKDFLKVTALAPQDLRAHLNLGIVYMRQKKWGRALEELRTAEKLAPKLAGIRFNIGLVYYRQGKYHEAIPLFESVIRDQPDFPKARQLLGLAYMLDERFADAAQALEKLWPSMNGDLNYLYELALSAGKAGRHDLEERALARLLEADQQSADLHLLFGKTYLSRGEDERALAELEKAAEINPKLPMLHYHLGLIYKRKHDYEKAKAEFLEDVAIEPDVAYSYDELGTVSLDLVQEDEARGYFEQALKRNSKLPTAWYGLAKIEREGKHYAEALKDLDEASALVPASASVHYLRAQTLAQLGRQAEAQKEFATVRRLKREALDTLEQQMMGTSYRDPELAAEQK